MEEEMKDMSQEINTSNGNMASEDYNDVFNSEPKKSESGKMGEILKGALAVIVCAVIVVLFTATDLPAMIFESREYNLYKYSLECVEERLAYPDTAEFKSYKKTSIVDISDSPELSKKVEKPHEGWAYWEVSGTFKAENKLGQKLNVKYVAIIYSISKSSGSFYCESCVIE